MNITKENVEMTCRQAKGSGAQSLDVLSDRETAEKAAQDCVPFLLPGFTVGIEKVDFKFQTIIREPSNDGYLDY